MTFALRSLRARISPSPLRTSRLPALVVPLVLLGGGCKDRLYDFGGTVKAIDASATGTAGMSSGDALPLPDARVDLRGVADTGGMDAGGGARGSAGGGAGGAVQLCDRTSPDRQTDPFNCGTCLNSCTAAISVPDCAGGICKITCVGDFVDADKNLSNGCECEPSNGGVESCDGLDNNCNGTVDEGFDFQNDIDNCGGCNKRCSFPFATATCKTGVCTQGACLAGFYDRDPNVPGCETACQKTNGGVEICDGLDNDCDGPTDDTFGIGKACAIGTGACAGTH